VYFVGDVAAVLLVSTQGNQLSKLLELAELMEGSDLAALVQVARRIADD
jgi:hypothetical protein